MRIPLHEGPYARDAVEVGDDPPPHITYLFSAKPIFPFHQEVYLDVHVYSLQTLRGSQTSHAYVYAGIKRHRWQAIPVELLDTCSDTSDIVTPEGTDTVVPKRPRGRPRKVTAQ